MYSLSNDQELHTEATVAPVESQETKQYQHTADQNSETQNHKGETMGEQTKQSEEVRQDQHSADQNSETQNQKGEKMGEQTKQDQNVEPQEEVKKERVTPKNLEDYLIQIDGADEETGVVTINNVDYDGTQAPRIALKNLNSSKAVNNAMLRIKVRYNYLMKEYFRLKGIVEDNEGDTISRKLAKDQIGEIDEALESLKIKKKDVEDQKITVEESVENELVNPDVSLENSFKF